jgi:nitrogen-specific signal transduction histidine kinase
MSLHILVTDSNTDERALCARLLGTSDLEYTVTLVSNAIEYANTLNDPSVDIAVIGINTGFCATSDLIQSLAAKSIPVILMVASEESVLAQALEPYGVTRRIEKTPAGYLALPTVIRQVLNGEYDSVTVGGIPEALVHAVGGTTFAMALTGRLLRASGPALNRIPLPAFEAAISAKLMLNHGSSLSEHRTGTAQWKDIAIDATSGTQTRGALAVSTALDTQGSEIIVGVFVPTTSVTEVTALNPSHSPQRLQQVTHDLKAPLRGVARTLNILRAPGSSLSHEDRSLLDGAHAGIMDAIDALRNALKPLPATETMPPFSSSFDSTGLTSARIIMDDVERILRPEIEDRRATLRIGVLPDLPVEAQDLRTIFTNLVDNALQHSTVKSPTITVQATRRGSAWLFSVHDNGAGIESREVEKIFEMNTRGSNAQGQGNGVGLALCRQAVERYGGSIWVTTGAGSTFQFTLPAIGLVGERVMKNAAGNT